MNALNALRHDLRTAIIPEKAKFLPKFFKTGPGQYAQDDQFLGVTVPAQRLLVKKYWSDLSLADATILLHSPIHEERLTALLILVRQYQKQPEQRADIYNLYLANTARINNWDLVDSSAEFIVGPYLQDRNKAILNKLAASSLIWDRRIAMLATFHYIKQSQFEWPLRIAGTLCCDQHDLIQKAVGWMLREIGKRDRATEAAFLVRHYRHLPRTTLRYAIEHFDPDLRQKYLKGQIA